MPTYRHVIDISDMWKEACDNIMPPEKFLWELHEMLDPIIAVEIDMPGMGTELQTIQAWIADAYDNRPSIGSCEQAIDKLRTWGSFHTGEWPAPQRAFVATIPMLESHVIALDPVSRLDDSMEHLQVARDDLARFNDITDRLLADLQATPEYAAYAEAAELSKSMAAIADTNKQLVGRAAIDVYKVGADSKKVHPACTVTVGKQVAYDIEDATRWARENAPMFLRLDTGPFEKTAKAGTLAGAPAEILPKYGTRIATDIRKSMG